MISAEITDLDTLTQEQQELQCTIEQLKTEYLHRRLTRHEFYRIYEQNGMKLLQIQQRMKFLHRSKSINFEKINT
jgi:hypothetical protein